MINNNKKFKVCLLGANFSTGNMGVGALIAGAIKAILHYRPDAEIIFAGLQQGSSDTIFSLAAEAFPFR
jgi:hypothetical protein